MVNALSIDCTHTHTYKHVGIGIGVYVYVCVAVGLLLGVAGLRQLPQSRLIASVNLQQFVPAVPSSMFVCVFVG